MLERLARTMYRRRRRVLVAWIVLLIGTFMLSGVIGGAFHTEFKLPGTESQAAFDLLQKSSFRDRQVQGQIVFKSDERRRTIRRCRSAMQGLFDKVEADDSRTSRSSSPYSPEGARQIGRNDPNVAYAEVNFADRSNEAVPGRRQEDQGARRPGRRARPRDRVRRRHVRHEPDQRRHRGDRNLLAAMIILLRRVRLGARDGAADRHRAVRHRHRCRDRADHAQRPRHARLHHRRRRDGRHRRGHRLRAVHRHALPREPRRRSRPGTQRRARHRHRRPRGVVRRIHGRDLGARPAGS